MASSGAPLGRAPSGNAAPDGTSSGGVPRGGAPSGGRPSGRTSEGDGRTPVTRLALIAAILKKDLLEFSRERIYMVLSVAGLVLFVAVYWVIPDTVDEEVTVGAYLGPDAGFAEAAFGSEAGEGLDLLLFDNREELRAVLAGTAEAWRGEDGRLIVRDLEADDPRPVDAGRVSPALGIALPDGFFAALALSDGEHVPAVTLFVNDETPPEVRSAMRSMIREMAFTMTGAELPVTVPPEEEVLLGADRLASPLSMRDRLRPMLAFFVLMMETFALASLIAGEISSRTVTAVVATPARLGDVLAAKSIHGVALALGQAVILLAAIGALTASAWPLLLLAAFLGAAMFTGIAMAVGSAGRDFIGTLFLCMVCIVPLLVPAFSALFPGAAPAWVRVLPTHGVMHALMEVTTYGGGWPEVAGALGVAALWVVAIFAVGLLILARKVARL